jgi:hypothetical protein
VNSQQRPAWMTKGLRGVINRKAREIARSESVEAAVWATLSEIAKRWIEANGVQVGGEHATAHIERMSADEWLALRPPDTPP